MNKKRIIMINLLWIYIVLLVYQEVECIESSLQESDIEKLFKQDTNISLPMENLREETTEINSLINTTQSMIEEGDDKVENAKHFPYITFIEKKASNGNIVLCTGILLNTTHVITTANCTLSLNISDIEIHLGKSKDETGVYRNIIKRIYNPVYKNETFLNIVLLEMDKPVNETSKIQSINQSHFDEEINNRLEELKAGRNICQAVGYGTDSKYRNDSSILRPFNVSLVEWNDCVGLNSANNQTQHNCDNSTGKEHACNLSDVNAFDCQGNDYGIFILNSSKEDCRNKLMVFTRLDGLVPLFNNYPQNVENDHIIVPREVENDTINEVVTPTMTSNDTDDLMITTIQSNDSDDLTITTVQSNDTDDLMITTIQSNDSDDLMITTIQSNDTDDLMITTIKSNDSSDAVEEPTILLPTESKHGLTPTLQPLCETLRRPPPGVNKFTCTNTVIGCCLDNCYKEFRKSYEDDSTNEEENREEERSSSAIPGYSKVSSVFHFVTILINVLFINSNKFIL